MLQPEACQGSGELCVIFAPAGSAVPVLAKIGAIKLGIIQWDEQKDERFLEGRPVYLRTRNEP